jgi:predicted metalloprotease
MRWQGRRKSSNIDDRRGKNRMSSARGNIPVGMTKNLFRLLFSKTGLIIIAIFLIISWIAGKNPLQILQMFVGLDNTTTEVTTEYVATPEEEEMADFVSVVLADTEDVWNMLLDNYREPTLVLFTGGVRSSCGQASSATGPFYCSADEKVYIDLGFYRELKDRFNAPGDFAQAYVIAHEVGHHVQHLLGITDKVHAMRDKLSEADYNQLSVKLELQADFLAGVWAHHAQRTKNILESGDYEEALKAASAIGDDRIQKQTQGYVIPDSFTHGTSEQRMRWFKKGFETGNISEGDTFNASEL